MTYDEAELDAPDATTWRRRLLPLWIGLGIAAACAVFGYFVFTWTLSTTIPGPACSAPQQALAEKLRATPVLTLLPADASSVNRYVRCETTGGDTAFAGTTFASGQSRADLVTGLEQRAELGTWRRGRNGTNTGTSPDQVHNIAFTNTRTDGRLTCVSLLQDAPKTYRLEVSGSTLHDTPCP